MNKIVLTGRLTANPECRYTTNNTAVASFTLAVNRNYKSENGENEADFINVVVWNKKAELINQYVSKGDLIGVIGRLQVRKYQNERGENRYVTEVVLEEIEFLSSKKSTFDKKRPVNTEEKNTLEQQLNNNPYEEFANEHQEELNYINDAGEELPF